MKEKETQSTYDKLCARAKKAGTSISELCRRANVDRSTPQRWKDNEPKTLQILNSLEAELDLIEQENNLKDGE